MAFRAEILNFAVTKYISVKIQEVVSALEQFAPLPLQEDFDNAGLQVGLTEAEVSGALLCLDVNEAVVDEAIAQHCNLIVAHHPLIFHKLARLTGETYVQRAVMKAIKAGITILSMHTNMDRAKGGVNYKIAERLHLSNVHFAKPETIVGVECGSMVVGEFENPLAAQDFITLLKKQFDVACAQCNELLERPIKRVAICGGGGAFMLDDAIAAGADAFVTGEMRYHEFFGHEQEIQIAVIGHYQSEQYTKEIFKSIIEERCPSVRCLLTTVNTNPINYL